MPRKRYYLWLKVVNRERDLKASRKCVFALGDIARIKSSATLATTEPDLPANPCAFFSNPSLESLAVSQEGAPGSL